MNVERPASWKVLPKSLAESEVGEMLARTGAAARAADADGLALRDHAMLELLYAGGLRVGEIVGLRMEDLRLDAAAVQVRGRATRSGSCRLGARRWRRWRLYLERGRPGLVRAGAGMQRVLFLSVRGKALTPQVVWEMVRAVNRDGESAQAAA